MTYAQTSSFTSNQPFRLKRIVSTLMQHTFWLNMATLALLILCSFFYIIQVNGTASKGYAIRDLENSIRTLTLSNERMEVDAREAQSLANIQRSVKMIGLVQETHPTYLDASGASYAFAK